MTHKISHEAFMAAVKKLRQFPVYQPMDFVIVNRRYAERLKMDQHFEPLHLYSQNVQPYDGEIGRYDCDGLKIRIVVNNVKVVE